jgi:ribosomal protein L17
MIKYYIISFVIASIIIVSLIENNVSGLLISTKDIETKDLTEPLLSEYLIKDTVEKVKASKFIERRNIIMSTIGKSNYLDQHRDVNREITNNYIKNEFSELLDITLKHFKNKLKTDVRYLADLDNKKYSLPGFHIFDCNYISTFQVASIHKDLQYQTLIPDFDIDLDKTISFTICLEAQKGPHIYFFYPKKDNFLPKIIKFNNVKKYSIHYKPGNIVSHNGHDYHMIAPNKTVNNTKRITMQGHIIYDKRDQMYYIYW